MAEKQNTDPKSTRFGTQPVYDMVYDLGYDMGEIADTTGINGQRMRRAIHGYIPPADDIVVALVGLLNVDKEQLFTEAALRSTPRKRGGPQRRVHYAPLET